MSQRFQKWRRPPSCASRHFAPVNAVRKIVRSAPLKLKAASNFSRRSAPMMSQCRHQGGLCGVKGNAQARSTQGAKPSNSAPTVADKV